MFRLVLLLTAVFFSTHCTEVRAPFSTANPPAKPPARVDATVAQTQATKAPAISGDAPAQKAYIDPDSGELVPQPVDDATAQQETLQPSTLGTSTATMDEQPSPVPDGGMMIDLEGRFQSPVKATIDDNGTPVIEHPADQRSESDHAAP